MTCKISSPNDLYCVEWDVKPYSTQPTKSDMEESLITENSLIIGAILPGEIVEQMLSYRRDRAPCVKRSLKVICCCANRCSRRYMWLPISTLLVTWPLSSTVLEKSHLVCTFHTPPLVPVELKKTAGLGVSMLWCQGAQNRLSNHKLKSCLVYCLKTTNMPLPLGSRER